MLLSPTISTKIKLFNRSQILTGIWLLFIFRNPESLTNVVYFDVWPVCVVGRSLTGVIICLGNCEPEEGEIKKQRGRENTAIKSTKLSQMCVSGTAKLHMDKAELFVCPVPLGKHEEILD